MRIANFTFAYAPLMTGISAVVHDRARLYLELGHEVHLIHPDVETPPRKGSSECVMYGVDELQRFSNFRSWTFPTRRHPFRGDFFEARSTRHWSDVAILEQIRPDVVVVDEALGLAGLSSFGWGGYGRTVGTRYARENGIASFHLMHVDWLAYARQGIGRWPTAALHPFLRYYTRRIARAYSRTIAPSRALQATFQHDFDGKIEHLLFFGVNTRSFLPENIRYNPLPGNKDPVLLYTGRIAVEKSIDVLLKAFRIVVDSVPNARLYILGSGPALEKYRRRARREFGGSVEFPGSVFGNELKGWYARADVYWTASVTENFSMAILEALASGTPVVASAAGGNVEQINHGDSGYCVTPKSHLEMARRTIEILNDPALHAKLRRGARNSALRFDDETAMKRLLAEFCTTHTAPRSKAAA